MAGNDIDPEDVLASSFTTMFVRVGVFLVACILGHGLGMFSAMFVSFSDLWRLFGDTPGAMEIWEMALGTFVPIFVMGILTVWLAPWLIAFGYFGYQFFLTEDGWIRWFPWLTGGQAIFSYCASDNFGVGVILLMAFVASVIAGWMLLQAKLYERTMMRFDEIEAENRRKRRAKNQGEDSSRTQ